MLSLYRPRKVRKVTRKSDSALQMQVMVNSEGKSKVATKNVNELLVFGSFILYCKFMLYLLPFGWRLAVSEKT